MKSLRSSKPVSRLSTVAPRYMQVTGLADGSKLRTASLEGRSHIIVPVVSFVGNSIVRPMHSEGPEFVPESVISSMAESWNGRPILPNHPGDGLSSANTPETLDREKFGVIFNSRAEDGRLKQDAWLDLTRAESVGQDAVDVIARCQAGEMVEVSIGAYIRVAEESGVYDGKPYDYVWQEMIASDHLAMGLGGHKGACSVAMGCGAPRMNASGMSEQDIRDSLESALYAIETGESTDAGLYIWIETYFDDVVIYHIRTEGNGDDALYQREYSIDEVSMAAKLGTVRKPVKRHVTYEETPNVVANSATPADDKSTPQSQVSGFASRVSSVLSNLFESIGGKSRVAITPSADMGMSDADLRSELWRAIHAIEPGFDGVVEVYPDMETVIYTTYPEDDLLWWQRTYSKSDDGTTITLNDDRMQVEPTMEYKQVAASTENESESADATNEPGAIPCSCHTTAKGNITMAAKPKTNTAISALSNRLIASESAPFDEANRGALESMDAVGLTALCKAFGVDPADPKPAIAIGTIKATASGTADSGDDDADDADSDDSAHSPRVLTEAEFVAIAPPSIRAALGRLQAQEETHRATLISAIGKTAGKIYSPDKLKSMETAELELLADAISSAIGTPRKTIANAASYLGKGLPVDESTPAKVATPRIYSLALGGNKTDTADASKTTN